MYKVRGKPESSHNRAIAEQHKQLAKAINVQQIPAKHLLRKLQEHTKSPASSIIERSRRRNHFEEFRETYQQRFQKSQERGTQLKNEMLENVGKWLKSNEEAQNQQEINLVNRIDLQNKKYTDKYYGPYGDKKPVMLRAPLRNIKSVKVVVPTAKTKRAVVLPPRSRKDELLLEKLKKMEKTYEDTTKYAEEGVQVDLLKELEQTRDQIDIASSQLKQIQMLLNQKKKNYLESSESFNIENDRIKTKWLVPSPDLKRKTGKSRLIAALNNVNVRLQKMQEKYFNAPHCRYKSINEVGKLPVRKDVQVIYENGKFLTLKSETSVESSIVQKNQKLTESKSILQKLFGKIKSRDPSPVTEERRPEDLERSEDRFVNKHVKFENDSSPTEIKLDSSSVNVILSPRSDKRAKSKKETRTSSAQYNDKIPEFHVPASVLDQKLKESILKSDFLKKELKVNNLHCNVSNVVLSKSKKSVRFVPQSSSASSIQQSERLKSTFEQALKYSLYTT